MLRVFLPSQIATTRHPRIFDDTTPASNVLGRYEGAGLGPTYGSIIDGLGEGSAAAWAVVLGPYLLFLLFKALLAWWRAANWA